MRRLFATLFASLLICTALAAQVAPPSVQATGSATINANPDQAQLSVTVTTQGATAQEAGQLNASVSTTVQAAIKALLSLNGTIQTTGYSVYPRYNNTGTTLIGYSASNTIQVTTTNLSIIGALIDTANQAGATTVGGLSFGIQNPDPIRLQALTAATKQALGHAQAIAAGFGLKTGAVLAASESGGSTPIFSGIAGAAAPTTPVQTGTVGVSATVAITVALVQ